MDNPAIILTGYVLEKMQGEPIAKRIELTRAAAALLSNKEQSVALTLMADELAAIEQRHEQLVLNFKQRRRGGAS